MLFRHTTDPVTRWQPLNREVQHKRGRQLDWGARPAPWQAKANAQCRPIGHDVHVVDITLALGNPHGTFGAHSSYHWPLSFTAPAHTHAPLCDLQLYQTFRGHWESHSRGAPTPAHQRAGR